MLATSLGANAFNQAAQAEHALTRELQKRALHRAYPRGRGNPISSTTRYRSLQRQRRRNGASHRAHHVMRGFQERSLAWNANKLQLHAPIDTNSLMEKLNAGTEQHPAMRRGNVIKIKRVVSKRRCGEDTLTARSCSNVRTPGSSGHGELKRETYIR
jgi:hypothetical protein